MATNNIKPFAIGNGANVTSQADYESLSALLTGFQSGKASSAQINKALRQSSFVASVLAQFISNAAGVDVLDNGNATALLNNFIAALKANGANDFLQKSSNLTDVADKTVALSTLGGAPLASPTFTGTPKGPTAAAGTNTTQFATTAFAQSLIPGLLKASNNLSEIEAAGPAAVASALANLGLGDVIREDDANAQFKLKHWSSAGSTLTTNTPLIINHGLTINPDLCSLNIKLRCVAANNGYSPGDYCVGFYPRITGGDTSAAAGAMGALLTATTCQFNVGNAGIALMPKGSGVAVGINTTATFAQWAFEFHIIYQ
ncbi:hypothetical protein ERHA54_34900 [Erwinia rhapontici]|uniref:hypothetical protein n=1 Tax=Erwinia rhapontici TaxID=55212 RepID=UPI001BB33A72|nr:hypothetical protein [Erwinia rhapontici]BCQ40887.1 hypothetical protein ERHA54_34900 [Erwinia rhapontici]